MYKFAWLRIPNRVRKSPLRYYLRRTPGLDVRRISLNIRPTKRAIARRSNLIPGWVLGNKNAPLKAYKSYFFVDSPMNQENLLQLLDPKTCYTSITPEKRLFYQIMLDCIMRHRHIRF
jgi:hypothetical protein